MNELGRYIIMMGIMLIFVGGIVYILGDKTSWFGNFGSLEYIDLSENLFSGELPHTITSIENLTYLNLSENDFTGELPDTWDDMQYLVDLNLSYNNLSGIIPQSLGYVEFIEVILLSRNDLSGWIPNSLSTLPNLRILKVAENELEGIIPGFVVYLESHAVYNNNFCPPYPPGCIIGSQNQENCMNYEQGNINQDEIIDILDVMYGMNLILGYIPFSNYETWASDVDGDGESDVQDIIYLVQLIINY